jgi:hypothetical protein
MDRCVGPSSDGASGTTGSQHGGWSAATVLWIATQAGLAARPFDAIAIGVRTVPVEVTELRWGVVQARPDDPRSANYPERGQDGSREARARDRSAPRSGLTPCSRRQVTRQRPSPSSAPRSGRRARKRSRGSS